MNEEDERLWKLRQKLIAEQIINTGEYDLEKVDKDMAEKYERRTIQISGAESR